MKSRSRRFLWFGAALVLLALGRVTQAQDGAESSMAIAPPSNPLSEIKDSEPIAAPSALEIVDGGFAKSVEWMASVLFYRVGAQTEEYVVFTGQQIYVRARGSQGDFQRLTSSGLSQSNGLAAADLEALFYKGSLIDPVEADARYFRHGELDGEPVDYLRVRVPAIRLGETVLKIGHDAKLVKDGDVYYAISQMRDTLNGEISLKKSQAEALQQAGWLKAEGEGADRTVFHSGKTGGAPVVVIWLALGAIFFTLYMKGFNIWGFRHAVEVVRGKYDNPEEDGEVTHFQALASALSATVGLGNIAGVTIAMTIGGPGAFFWMICCGLFGMTSKFVECTLGQKYRTVKPDGTVLGGPMVYLKNGLAELGMAKLGLVMSVLFTVMCILASFGGGNMFQINQSGKALLGQIQQSEHKSLKSIDVDIKAAAIAKESAKVEELRKLRSEKQGAMSSFATRFNVGYGAVMAFLVGIVIIGGIKRIGAAAEKVVPSMCLIYVLACLWIILTHITEVPALVVTILSEAFNGSAIRGGLVGVLVIGVQRAAFSNEAGVGSAAIAHSAAKTQEPVREGAVALLGPFIDTIIVCSMTALVILITGAWENSAWVVEQGLSGAALTSQAFESEIAWFPWVLSVAVVLFAFSTVVSWSYYGERCWEMLFGQRSVMAYKVLSLACVFVGAVVNAGSVLDFSDMMILSMAFPNVLGVALLSPKVRADLADYWKRYKAGEFEPSGSGEMDDFGSQE